MNYYRHIPFIALLLMTACGPVEPQANARWAAVRTTDTPVVHRVQPVPTVARIASTRAPGPDADLPPPHPFVRRRGATAFGMQINGCASATRTALDADLTDIADLGFTWIKQQVRWGDMTTPARIDWSCLDQVVPAVNHHGFRLLLSVTTAPAHLRMARDTLGFPDRLEDFGHFLHALLTRYPGQVHALEVWNEPNIVAESSDGVSALRYMAFLTMGYGIARHVDPAIRVISAAPAPVAVSTGIDAAIADDAFLNKLFEYDGLNRLDCIGAHANGPAPDGNLDTVVTRYASLSGGARPLCVTEFGYALPVQGRTPPGFAWAMQHTSVGQTDALLQGARWALARDDVPLVILWNWNYFSPSPADTNAPYALVRPGWRSPALAALRALLRPQQEVQP